MLNRRLRSVGDQSKRTDSGFRDVAELMNRLDPLIAREILDNIEREEPQAGDQHSRSDVHLR